MMQPTPPMSPQPMPSPSGGAMPPMGMGASAAPGPSGGPAQLTITPASLEAHMRLLPAQKLQLQRIVVAGMKVMFSPQTRAMVQTILAAPHLQMPQKIATGVAGLLGILMKESGGSLPKQLLIPAGVLLTVHAAELVDKAQMVIGDADVGQAIELMTRIVLGQFHMSLDKFAQMGASGQIPKQPPKGIVGGAMQPPPQGGAQGPQGPDPTGNPSIGPISPMGAAGVVKLGGGV